jgi:GxxExxY protein
VDLIIDEQIVVEIKVVKAIGPHHVKQTVTYLKGLDLRLGLILNFGAPSLRYGIKRIVNSRPNAPK